MKNLLKYLFALVLLIAVNQSYAQNNLGSLLSANALALDTVDNTAAVPLTLAIAGSQASVSIVATVTEISGTTAGSVKLWGSVDGTIYALIDGAGTFSPTDTAGAQSYAWQVSPSGFTHYRLIYTGAGTMSAQFKAKALWRK